MSTATSSLTAAVEASDPGVETGDRVIRRRLAPLFFVSGVAALVYQVCWQRLLFASFGVDIESVTIIVSVFMLGLGLGALVGGALADRYPSKAMAMFAACELTIGVFGFFSPAIIRWTGETFVLYPQPVIAVVNFLLLLVPTSLMGATLPVLVAFVTRRWHNVGRSIGLLYQVNTLGAAIGAAVVGFGWFMFFELDSALRAAAALNVLVSLGTLAFLVRRV